MNIVLRKPYNLEFIQRITQTCSELTELAVVIDLGFGYQCNSINFIEKEQDSVKFLAENVTTKLKKLSFSNLKSVRNEHVEILVKRCDKLTELNLNGTNVDIRLISSIYQNLGNLEKLDVPDIVSAKLHQLQTLTKLKVLNSWNITIGEWKTLKKQLPQVCLNQERFRIATSWQNFKREHGFWDIHAVQLQTFKERSSIR